MFRDHESDVMPARLGDGLPGGVNPAHLTESESAVDPRRGPSRGETSWPGGGHDLAAANLANVLRDADQPVRMHSKPAALHEVIGDERGMVGRRATLAEQSSHERGRVFRGQSHHPTIFGAAAAAMISRPCD